MFGRKKKQIVEFPLQRELEKQLAILEDPNAEWTWDEYERQYKLVAALTKQKADWDGTHKPDKVGKGNWLAAGVTGLCGLAPYGIEQIGKRAEHLKQKVQLPKIWK